jgi:hypothetical protein
MSDIRSEILTAVQSAPGIGPGQVADMLGQDKSYVRRVMKGMGSKGKIRAEVNGNGYTFYPVNGGAPQTDRKESFAFASAPRRATLAVAAPSVSASRPAQFARRQNAPNSLVSAHQREINHGVLASMPGRFELDEDGTLHAEAIARQEREAKDAEMAAVIDRETRLRQELAAKDAAHAAELAAVRQRADSDALLVSLSRNVRMSDHPVEKPRSLLAEAREARRREMAEAVEMSWLDSLAKQKREFPPLEYPGLYRDLDPVDVPELFDDMEDQPMEVDAKPNGRDAPVIARPKAAATAGSTDKTEGWPLGVKWTLALGVLAAGVLAVIRFPLR